MIEEILKSMESRQKHRHKNPVKYGGIQKKIKKESRSGKEKWFSGESGKCINIEEIQQRYDSFNLPKRIKEMTSIFVKRTSNLVNKKRGLFCRKLKNWRNRENRIV